MKRITLFFFATLIAAVVIAQGGRKTIEMDTHWRFALGAQSDAVQPTFDDAAWRLVDVPHDWSIEGEYDKNNPTGRGGGYLPSGEGWYRKSFRLDKQDKGKKVFIEFDGVMANSEVYINGKLLGIWPYGYTSFIYEMTDHLNFDGKDNVLTVRANNTPQPASRWYTGAGIYRHVRMYVKNSVHVDHWGVFVTTPEVSKSAATVLATTKINNTSAKASKVVLQTSVLDAQGKVVGATESTVQLAANSSEQVEQSIAVSQPQLWDTKNPSLYQLQTKVVSAKTVIDQVQTDFGIRSIRFDAAKGFLLNGEQLKLYGVCIHHDGGGVGAAVPAGVWEYRFNRLKEAGINAIRTAHNPMSPEFYDLCDRMGLLVMNESFDTWNYAKNPHDYHLYFNDWWERDTRAMVMRDRNHPSVVIYSVGNEIRDRLNDEAGFKKYKQQQDLIHELDPTRPVTMALFRPNSSGVYNNGFADSMDVVGQNYRPRELLAAHQQNPGRKVLGTENIHDLETYLALRDNDFMAGQFLWPGIDYLGESLWPKIAYDAGLFDKAGGWKRNGLLRRAWWGSEPNVAVVRKSDNSGAGEWVHDWSPVDPLTYDEADLEIYTNADEVELFLNGESIEIFERPDDHAPITTTINFRKGELRAEARTNGVVVATDVHRTAAKPHKLVLTPLKSSLVNNREDVVYVKASVVDENGVTCPNTEFAVTFAVEGAGVLRATDNGNSFSHEQNLTNHRNTYQGECYAIIMANQNSGKVTITASAEGLVSASAEIVVGK